jgi:ADP-ribose pyrophosphatase YjhB (NUDIX family)
MAKFCPECGKLTIKIKDGYLLRDACPDAHFVQFARTKIGVGAMIIRDGTILLIERGIPPIGLWTLVSGHIEENETLDKAIIREVKEEVGMDVLPQGIVFVRNMQEGGKNDVYVIFLCTVAPDAIPVPDALAAERSTHSDGGGTPRSAP